MLNKALFTAIKAEKKELSKENDRKIEKDFVLDNWELFADNKGAVKGALLSSHPESGTDLLLALDIHQTVIHKVPKEELVQAVFKMEGSDLFKKFLKDCKNYGEVTSIFIVSRRALVMSNRLVFKLPGKFMHKLESNGSLPDIYWQWADELKGKVRLY